MNRVLVIRIAISRLLSVIDILKVIVNSFLGNATTVSGENCSQLRWIPALNFSRATTAENER